MSRLSPPKISFKTALAANAGAAAYSDTCGPMEFRTEIHHVGICDRTGHTLQAANYLTFALYKVAAVGGAEVLIASRTTNNTGGTALAAGVPQSLTIITASNAHVVPAGDYLRFKITAATATNAAVDMTVVISHTQYTSNNPYN